MPLIIKGSKWKYASIVDFMKLDAKDSRDQVVANKMIKHFY